MPQPIVLKDVKEIITDQLSVDLERVVLEAKLDDDLGADSLDLVELISEFEDEFGVEFRDEYVLQGATVAQALELINELRNK